MTRGYLLFFFSLIFIQLSFGQQFKFRHLNYTHGLSNNRILSIAEDDNGFVWLGTPSGLNKFDGYQMQTYRHKVGIENSLLDNMVEDIEKDQLGRLWIFTPKGIVLFSTLYEEFTPLHKLLKQQNAFNDAEIDYARSLGDSLMLLRSEDHKALFTINVHNNVVVPYSNLDSLFLSEKDLKVSSFEIIGDLIYFTLTNAEIYTIDYNTNEVIRKISSIRPLVNDEEHSYSMYIDQQKRIWVYSIDANLGLFCVENNNDVKWFNTQSSPALNSNIVSDILQDESNKLWIGTDHGGLNILSADLKKVDYVVHDKSNDNSLSQNAITTLYKSSSESIWVGTFKEGINIYHNKLFKFNHYLNFPNDKKSLPYNDVNCFAEDENGNLYIGTNGEGLIYFDRKNNTFKKVFNDVLGKNVIVSLLIDKESNLWIGTYFGGLLKYDHEKLTHYLHNPKDKKSICDNRIWDIFEDSEGNLWIGTLGGGLDILDKKRNLFVHYKGVGENAIRSDFVMKINEDQDGDLWFGTDIGIYCLEKQNARFFHYPYKTDDDNSLSSNIVTNIFVDSRNNVWVGTRDGLNFFNKASKSFTHVNVENGLPDSFIKGVLESENGNLWIATSGGLCSLVLPESSDAVLNDYYTINYNELDGLQGREFNEASQFKTTNGELIFGGSNGFNMFKPEHDVKKTSSSKVFINGLKVFGREYNTIHEDALPEILNDQIINLSYKERIFSLDYLIVDHLRSDKIKYRYKLEGFEEQWINTEWNERKATFTNLRHGKYKFIVQASVYNSLWEQSQGSLTLIVHPPWYRTTISYLAFLILLISIIYFLRITIITRERIKYENEEAIREKERQQELNELKLHFFTNVSHEFRTPLSLIITPIEKLLKDDIKPSTRKHLELMNLNANKLLHLVNQLLDFRKAEKKTLHLNPICGDVTGFIRQIASTFHQYKESKKIALDLEVDQEEFFMLFDKDKLEKIVVNLLSNAFKFSKEGGTITMKLQCIKHQESELFEIRVIDNGIGISKEDKDKIFDRFYQAKSSNAIMSKGSGIGLSLVSDFVRLHNGRIRIESTLGRGSTFIVELPIAKESIEEQALIGEAEDEPELLKEDASESKYVGKSILFVEDNKEFRYYLKDSFKDKFKIFEASNGNEALLLLEQESIDIVVSDVMMPEMDGIQLCDHMKSKASFSHIPIILLTAKSSPDDKLEGLKHGADDYITKPFSFEILESRINYLISLRERFIKQFQTNLKVSADDKSISSLDKKFLDDANKLIHKNLSNIDFSVEKMSRELGMSRAYLYKKLNALTAKSPLELIRMVRLKRAAELLLEGELNVSEITYEVGFNDPKYFSKQFKAEFKVLPSKYKELHNNS